MKNWMVALVAVVMGVAVSAALLLLTNPSRSQVEVFAMARSVASGDEIAPDAMRLVPVIAQSTTSLFTRADRSQLAHARAAHDLVAGQLLQRSDVAGTQSLLDQRLVFLPVKDGPPTTAGETVDLFIVGGSPDSPSVVPFALGVPVRAVVAGGLVIAVPSSQATAFVYAAEVLRLVAVAGMPGVQNGGEDPITSYDQALAAVSRP